MSLKSTVRKQILKEFSGRTVFKKFSGYELDILPQIGELDVVLGYSPLKGEPDPQILLQVLFSRGVKVFLPRVMPDETLQFYAQNPRDSLQDKDFYGIPVPDQGSEVLAWSPPPGRGVVLVPGLAFDLKGNRLGRGKGFYDRFLSRLPEGWITLGLAHDFQIIDNIPTDPWDIQVSGLVLTGGGLIYPLG